MAPFQTFGYEYKRERIGAIPALWLRVQTRKNWHHSISSVVNTNKEKCRKTDCEKHGDEVAKSNGDCETQGQGAMKTKKRGEQAKTEKRGEQASNGG